MKQIVICVNSFFSGFFIPFTYIPDLADDFGMSSQQGAMLISIIGILNTVARVLVGWLADRPWADALKINSVALLIGGGTTMFVPYYSHFGAMATYCVVFGICIGMYSQNMWNRPLEYSTKSSSLQQRMLEASVVLQISVLICFFFCLINLFRIRTVCSRIHLSILKSGWLK